MDCVGGCGQPENCECERREHERELRYQRNEGKLDSIAAIYDIDDWKITNIGGEFWRVTLTPRVIQIEGKSHEDAINEALKYLSHEQISDCN